MTEIKVFMINKFNSKLLLAPMALAVLLAGCDRNDDDEDNTAQLDDPVNTVVVPPPQNNPFGVNVLILDQDGAAVTDASLLVIDDELNGNIVPDDSELLLVEEGTVRIPLNSFEQTALIRLEAEKDGFFSNGGRYELVAGEDLDIEIVLTSEESDVEGIRVVDTAGDLSQGSLQVTANSVDEAEGAVATVTVPQDLVIRDVEGNPLNNSLRMSVVHYDSRDETALSAFPGGFDVVVENAEQIDTPSIEGTIPVEDSEEVGSNVTFQSVGFTAIEIVDSEGNKADTFDGEIEVVMAIPPGTLNPQTREPLQVGDIIPVWSYDTDTARWEYESQEPVEPDGRGGLQVTYLADHLSYWNLDYWTNSNCDTNLDVTVVSSDGQPVQDSPVSITILGSDSNVGYRRSRTLASGTIQLLAVPGSFPVSMRVASAVPGVSVESVSRNGAPYSEGQAFRLCDGNGNGIDSTFTVQTDQLLDDIVEASRIDYSVNVATRCVNSPDTPSLPLANARVNYYSSDWNTSLQARTDSEGNARLQGQGITDGRIYVYYSGTSQGNLNANQLVTNADPEIEFLFDTQCVITTGANGQ